MTIDEILEKLYEQAGFEYDHREIHPDRISEAKSALLKEILGKMPAKSVSQPEFETINVNAYRNEILSDCEEAVESIFK